MSDYQLGRDISILLDKVSQIQEAIKLIGPGSGAPNVPSASQFPSLTYHARMSDSLTSKANSPSWAGYPVYNENNVQAVMAIVFFPTDGLELSGAWKDSSGDSTEYHRAPQTQWIGNPNGPHHLTAFGLSLEGYYRSMLDIHYQVSFGPGGYQMGKNGETVVGDRIYAIQAWLQIKPPARA